MSNLQFQHGMDRTPVTFSIFKNNQYTFINRLKNIVKIKLVELQSLIQII